MHLKVNNLSFFTEAVKVMVMMENVRGSHTYGRFKELYKAHCIYRVRSHVPSYCNVVLDGY